MSGTANLRTTPAKPKLTRDPKFRALVFQILSVIAVLAFFGYIVHNTLANMEARGISTGFGFLDRASGFAIVITSYSIHYTKLYDSMSLNSA